MLPYINDFPIEFRDYIASEIIPRYAGFDKAHRVDHVLKVIAESLNLSQYYDVSRMMVYVIASYHDLDATFFIALTWALPPTRLTERPTLMAGRKPWLKRSDST